MTSFAPDRPTALFVTHRGERCGVYQFGVRLYAALSTSELMRWHYAECADHEEFIAASEHLRPHVILVNFHPFTLAWASGGLNYPSALVFSIFHEANQSSLDQARDSPFDILLCPDPTLLPYDPSCLPVPRFIPKLLPEPVGEPATFSIGSFGFGMPGKGFESLCALVNNQFDAARIRINIPPHDSPVMTPAAATEAIAAGCRRNVTKPGISLEITHNFWDEAALLDFLASNTINAFLYDEAPGRGISSCTDYALACGRPIAISRSSMFRHLHGVNPSIHVDDRPLHAIARSGIAPLHHHRAAYESTTAGEAWNRTILDALQARHDSLSVPDGRGFNKILNDRSRAAYGSALADLGVLAPQVLARKIERANIQQAFVLDTARLLAARFAEPRILSVGSYEDTAVASLRSLGYRIDEVDPQVNGLDLEAFYRATDAESAYDLILCTSVLEHVPDDEGFVRMVGELLAPGGVAVFTVDFSNQYPRTGLRPAADYRLYTTDDLRQRLAPMLPDCMLLDAPDWDSDSDDFEYEGCRYSFATWVFRKVGPIPARHARTYQGQPDGAHWKSILREELRLSKEHAAALVMEHERQRAEAEQHIAALVMEHERQRAEAEQHTAALVMEHERQRAEAEQHTAALVMENERQRAEAEQHIATLVMEHEHQRAEAEQHIAALHQNLRAVTGRLNRLLQELRLEEGPKALHLVLPMARLIRNAHIRFRPTHTALPSSPQRPLSLRPSSPPPLPPSESAPARVVPSRMGRRLSRMAALTAYKLVRPVARPVAWRLRSFLIGGLAEQMRHQGDRIGALSALPVDIGGLAEQLQLLNERIKALSARPVEVSRLSEQVQHLDERIGLLSARLIGMGANDAATEMRRLAAEMERTLLTLAMERAPDTWPATAPTEPT